MTENLTPEDNLVEEFRNLSQNLVETLRSSWDSPERKKLQQDLENGLAELVSTVKKEADSFSQGPIGQQIKSDVETMRQRVQSGEVETRLRDELVNALRTINSELKKVTSRRSASKSEPEMTEAPPDEASPGEEEQNAQ